MTRSKPIPISPDDVRQFCEGTLAEDRLEQLMQAMEEQNPKVQRWLDVLSVVSDLTEVELEAANGTESSAIRELIGSRMRSLSRAELWAFAVNPLPALLRGESTVRCELFGKFAGRMRTLEATFERVSGTDREFALRIPDLPHACEPLNLTLADFDLGSEREPTPRELFEPDWPVVQPVQNAEGLAHDSRAVSRQLAASSAHLGLAFAGEPVRVENKAESKDFWMSLERNSSRILVQANRRSQSRLDVVLLEMEAEQNGRSMVTNHALLLNKLVGQEPEQMLETSFDLPLPSIHPPPNTVKLALRALLPTELCELSPPAIDTLLAHRDFAAPTLTRMHDGLCFRLLEADVARLAEHSGHLCALRVALPEMEVR